MAKPQPLRQPPTDRRDGTRWRGHVHHEARPTRRLVVADALKSVVGTALIGCAVALMLDTAAMLVALAVIPDAALPATERIGLGIVAASAAGILVFGLLYGFLATAARLALGAFYAGLAPKTAQLRDTLAVRGQANPDPYAPATASTITVGSLALLAAIPCIVLAAEHAGRLDDELHRAVFTQWVIWAGVLIATAGICAASVWLFSLLSRRWMDRTGSRLPKGALGDRGPSVRITTRAQRRAERRFRHPLDWAAWAGRVLVAVGAGLVFLGVYLRQPGLYAEQITYSADVERVIDAATAVGGALLAAGILVVAATGILAVWNTVRALRRAGDGLEDARREDRTRVRAATATLANTATAALIWWTVGGIVAVGWWFANVIETPAHGTATALAFLWPAAPAVLLVGWIALGLLLIGGRIALEAVSPNVRNRFGFTPPSEADDREFPNLAQFGQ